MTVPTWRTPRFDPPPLVPYPGEETKEFNFLDITVIMSRLAKIEQQLKDIEGRIEALHPSEKKECCIALCKVQTAQRVDGVGPVCSKHLRKLRK